MVDRALIEAGLPPRSMRRLPWARILLWPFAFPHPGVERIPNIVYGDAGRGNLLDVYRSRPRPHRGPTLIHLHGGGFRIGNKSREGRPLFYRLARQGWVCISANYRLRAQFPDPLVDVKKVIAWAREHGPEYGADPSVVFVAGSSAGGYLASMAALTANDPSLQPGFEDADTSVTGVVSLYGYYGSAGPGRSSPMAFDAHDAPPFFVAHPDRDTLVVVDDARRFVEHLRETSPSPVVYAELPGRAACVRLLLLDPVRGGDRRNRGLRRRRAQANMISSPPAEGSGSGSRVIRKPWKRPSRAAMNGISSAI